MLKTRVITAAFIAVAAFIVVFVAPASAFRASIVTLFMVGGWEFARLAALSLVSRCLLLAAQAALFVWLLMQWIDVRDHALAFLTAGCLSWCLMFLRLLTWRPATPPGLNYRFLSAFSGLASLFFAAFALFWLRDRASGEFLVLMLLLIIWCADIGAYFTGRAIGRHRLAPAISPGKTREGLAGGLVLATAVALAYPNVAPVPAMPAISLGLAAAITVLVSAGGDLFISIHKRSVGVKDSGRLFPGHGGVLDRFDSLLAGAPFFALGVLLMTYGTA